MMAAKGAVKPVAQVMSEPGAAFDPKAYLAAVTGYYTDRDGQMLSFPFNSSTPVLYYNKDAFKKAGLDPEQAAEDLGGGRGSTPRSCATPACRAATPPSWTVLGAGREHRRPGTTSRLRHQAERLRRARHRASDQPTRSSSCTSASSPSGRRPSSSTMAAAPTRRRPSSSAASARCSPRARPATPTSRRRQVRVGHRACCPTGLRRRRRAAELDHRRRLAVGDGRQDARDYKGVAQFFELPLARPRSRPSGTRDRLPADHAGRLRAHQEAGFYDKNPGTEIAVMQMNPNEPAKIEGPAPRQLRADPRHHRRGAGEGLRRQGDRRAGPRRRPSSAATRAAPVRGCND